MPAYWISHITVTDPEAFGRYAALAGPAIAAHGGRFLARNGAYVQLEGRDRPRNVIVEFADLATAQACYESADYQAALAHARPASEREHVLVEGLPA